MSSPCRSSSQSLRIAVLLGGISAEREISLQSGKAVSAALSRIGHSVCEVDPADTPLETVDWPRFDAAFLALHGQFGEDGEIQSLLAGWGVPFTGSDAGASRLAFSKSAAKERFAACGVPTPAYRLVHVSEPLRRLQQTAEQIGYPLVMKPDASGSSLGVSLVRDEAQLPWAAEECFRHGEFGLLEQAIAGTEWTLGVLDDQSLPLIRIVPNREFFDFTAKYQDDETDYRFDSDLPAAALREIEDAGLNACRAVGTRGIARADLRVDASLRPWVLEVNTIPGFTDHSLVPKAAARAGWNLSELCDRAIRSCLAAHGRKVSPSTQPAQAPVTGQFRKAG